MEMALNNGFCEMSQNDMCFVEGGGWSEAGAAFLGTVFIGISPAVGVAAGIGAGAVATPVVGIPAGIAAGTGLASVGADLLDWACQ